jgi:coproporphyrinogen III oxidase-like Fe-S oxidoreductase
VTVARLRGEFGAEMVSPSLRTAEQLASDGLLTIEGDRVRLTTRGRLLANEVFQQFLELDTAAGIEA